MPAYITYDPTTQKWTLERDLYVKIAPQMSLIVPGGFVTDLASVPRAFWNIIAPMELSEEAAMVHDWLYEHGGWIMSDCAPEPKVHYTRARADALLRDLALKNGVSRWRAYGAYAMVRAFGGSSWQNA